MTNVVWDRFLDYDWRARLLPDSEQGRITATEMMRRGYADVRQDQQALLQTMRQSLEIRAGFQDLLALCQSESWHFAVVSNGLRFYIESALGNRVEIWAHDAHFDTRWHVEMPSSLALDSSLDFKAQVVAELKLRHPNAKSVYIGDGRLDFEPALSCDHVLCVRDSALQRLCERAGVTPLQFSDFHQVIRILRKLLDHG